MTENHKNHIYIYSTRYFSEVEVEVRSTEDWLRQPGWRGKDKQEKGGEEEEEEEEGADKEEEEKEVSPGEERVVGGGEGSLQEKQSHTGAAVVGDKGLFCTLFFFPWNILRKEIRGCIVTHFHQLCQYNRWGGRWLIIIYMGFAGGGGES